MTEPGPCCWCNGGEEFVKVESKPFLGRTLWRVRCCSYPCELMTYTAYGWTREAAVARYNRKREKELTKRWSE
jgi:hypothetical protein